MSNYITYEQPLNEKVRSFLRLEFLFDVYEQKRLGKGLLDARETIYSLIDVIDLLSRSDIKSDLIKELENHQNTLSLLSKNPNVDQEQLNLLLNDIHHLLSILHNPEYQPGKSFNSHDLMQSVKQRKVITGGGCNFDLPNYHHWLSKPYETRTHLIDELYSDFSPVDKSIRLCLHILRNSSSPTNELAKNGFFQKNLDSNINCHLLQIKIDEASNCYPEISAGKHRISIRFMNQDDTRNRPKQVTYDVNFKLLVCIS